MAAGLTTMTTTLQNTAALDAMAKDAPSLWWLSFCDPTMPKGSKFLGAIALEVPAGIDPIRHAWNMNLNPGGEVMFGEVPADQHKLFPDSVRNRLLSRQEAEAL